MKPILIRIPQRIGVEEKEVQEVNTQNIERFTQNDDSTIDLSNLVIIFKNCIENKGGRGKKRIQAKPKTGLCAD